MISIRIGGDHETVQSHADEYGYDEQHMYMLFIISIFKAMQMNMDMMNSMYMCCVSACAEN